MTHKTLLKSVGVAALLSLGAGAAVQAQTIITTSNGIIRNSLCVGGDCQSGIPFSDSTIIVKENNTRIKFADTSTINAFPRNDWELEANSQTNGGPNRFSLFDCGESSNDGGCGGSNVFSVEAGAGNNALYVDDGGRVGFGTGTPVVELHVQDGDTPTLRLEQTNANGFTPQTYDVAGNEANFFIRDVTNGSALPFRLRPSAPTNSIFVDTDGDVGMGIASPEGALHVFDNAGSGLDIMLKLENNGDPGLEFENTGNGNIWVQRAGLSMLMDHSNDGTFEFNLANTGNLTILGTLTENSDKHNKMAIEPVDTTEILTKVAALPVSTWTYKHDAEAGTRHIGPMAQDFYALFGTGATDKGISTLDTSGVALAAIKALADQNADLIARIETLEAQLAK